MFSPVSPWVARGPTWEVDVDVYRAGEAAVLVLSDRPGLTNCSSNPEEKIFGIAETLRPLDLGMTVWAFDDRRASPPGEDRGAYLFRVNRNGDGLRRADLGTIRRTGLYTLLRQPIPESHPG